MLIIPDDFPQRLEELTSEQVFNAFHAFPIKPDYLKCERFNDWNMYAVHNILNYDSYVNMVQVVDSPNFPTAGKGLINIRSQPITEKTGIPYWGCLFVHYYQHCDIRELEINVCFKDRLVELSWQPFLHLGLRLYVVGSLSCASSYANDAVFSGWNKKTNPHNDQNNASMFEHDPEYTIFVKAFIKWLESCPIWMVAKKKN